MLPFSAWRIGLRDRTIGVLVAAVCLLGEALSAQVVSNQATADAIVVNGFVIAINVISGGAGYFSPPPVNLVGSGSNAVAVAAVNNGSVASITVIDAGSGYSTNTSVVIGPSSYPEIGGAQLYIGLEVVAQVGSSVDIQVASSFGDAYPWSHLATVTETVNPQLFFDVVAPGKSFYRVLPVPTNPNPAHLVWVPPGTFSMGSPSSEPGRGLDEQQHVVSITKGFWVSQSEVTQDDYQRVMLSSPSQVSGNPTFPVDTISWDDAQVYCQALSQRERDAARLPPGYVYRLPTEAEWEYAARGGSSQAYFFGDNPQNLSQYAWFTNDSSGASHAAATKLSSATGLFDVCGNVAEWCSDWYGPLDSVRMIDPQGPTNGIARVIRGGSWISTAAQCRSASRDALAPTNRSDAVGLRVILAEGSFNWPTNPYPSRLVWIPAGSFMMGSPPTELDRGADETLHSVALSKGFWVGKYEVTVGEYSAVTGTQSAEDTNTPVVYVSWFEATNYCYLLTSQERAAGRLPNGFVYRLPTESEWEYVARGGTSTRFHFGDDLSYTTLQLYAWFGYGGSISDLQEPVGLKLPSPQGLFDLYGNALEWCSDWYGSYPAGPVVDPKGPSSGSQKIARGGSVYLPGFVCRSAQRWSDGPGDFQNMYYPCGIRVVLGSP